MKIPPIASQRVLAAYDKVRTRQNISVPPVMRADAVELSPDALSFTETFRSVMASMDKETPADQSRRADLTQQIEKDAYQISARTIAGAILRGVAINDPEA